MHRVLKEEPHTNAFCREPHSTPSRFLSTARASSAAAWLVCFLAPLRSLCEPPYVPLLPVDSLAPLGLLFDHCTTVRSIALSLHRTV